MKNSKQFLVLMNDGEECQITASQFRIEMMGQPAALFFADGDPDPITYLIGVKMVRRLSAEPELPA